MQNKLSILKYRVRKEVEKINHNKKRVHFAEDTIQLAYCFGEHTEHKESIKYFRYYDDVISFLKINKEKFMPINPIRVIWPILKKTI